VRRSRLNACNPLAPRIGKNLGNPVVKRCGVRTLGDRRGIHLLSVNKQLNEEPAIRDPLDGSREYITLLSRGRTARGRMSKTESTP
jgi:hypothetical protein